MQKTNNEFVETVLMAIPADMLEEYGPVSAPVARAMAEGARKATTADCAVSRYCPCDCRCEGCRG